MTERLQDNLADDAIKTFLQHGLGQGLPRTAEMLLNAAMCFERSNHLNADSYERAQARTGLANGFKPRSIQTATRQAPPFPLEIAKNVTVRPSRMVEGPNSIDWEARCKLRLSAVRTISLVFSNRRGHPVPVGAATSAAAWARLSRHPRGVSFQISRCG